MVNLLTLRKREHFVALAKKGRSVGTKGLVLQCLERDVEDYDSRIDDHNTVCRVGFTATKRLGNAVVRNRTKRRLRALARDIIVSMGKAGYDYVIVGRDGGLGRAFNALQKDLKYALYQIHDPDFKQEQRPVRRGKKKKK